MYKKYLYVVAALITFASTLPAQARDFKHDNRNQKQFAEQDGNAQRHGRDEGDDERHHARRHNHHDEYYEDARYYYVDVKDHRRYDEDDNYHHHHRVYYPRPYLLDHFAVSLIFR